MHLRKSSKLMQNELILAINKSYNYINSVEQGKMMPAFEVIEQMCDVLQISPIQLFDENASPQSVKTFKKTNISTTFQKNCSTN